MPVGNVDDACRRSRYRDVMCRHNVWSFENTASNCVLWLIITRNAFDACDLPLIAAENRSHFPVGKRDLGKDAHLHRHIVLDHYLLAAQRLRDSGDRMAHYYDDANLHRSILARQRGAARLYTKELDRRSHCELHSCCQFPSDTMGGKQPLTFLPTRKLAALTLPMFTVLSVLSDLLKHPMCALILLGMISATADQLLPRHNTRRLRSIYSIVRRSASDVPKV